MSSSAWTGGRTLQYGWGYAICWIRTSENSVEAKFAECLLPRNPVPGHGLNILRAARGPRTSSLDEVEYPRAALGKGEPDDDAGVVIRHPDEDAYFARQAQWRAGVAHRGPGPAERATVQGEDIFFPCRSCSCGGTRLPTMLLRYSSAPNGC
jgi:hypothetical protein